MNHWANSDETNARIKRLDKIAYQKDEASLKRLRQREEIDRSAEISEIASCRERADAAESSLREADRRAVKSREKIIGYCGHPDAAEGCRLILAEITDDGRRGE